jgi:hypothetical protein
MEIKKLKSRLVPIHGRVVADSQQRQAPDPLSSTGND